MSLMIALASPAVATSVDEALEKVRRLIAEAGPGRADRVFPRSVPSRPPRPGLRRPAVRRSRSGTRHPRGLRVGPRLQDRHHPRPRARHPGGRQIAAYVFDPGGVLGCQTKNQLDPSEDPHYVPGDTRASSRSTA